MKGSAWNGLNLTSDIGLSDLRHGGKDLVTWDMAFSLIGHVTLWKISHRGMQHCNFLKLTCDIGDPPSRAPIMCKILAENH